MKEIGRKTTLCFIRGNFVRARQCVFQIASEFEDRRCNILVLKFSQESRQGIGNGLLLCSSGCRGNVW